ncbi:MAG: diaminopimelate epimerase [Prevotella sp.]|nr:diaminopimelate epimerase [Prevotella sp.]
MEKVRFTKMHGAGNDYVYVNTMQYAVADAEGFARRVSRPHFGIGSDGLVLIGAPSDPAAADFSMRIFNADGSEAMMCGNASRCVGKYLYERRLTAKTSVRLETKSGIKILKLAVEEGRVKSVTVDMLAPAFSVPSQFDEQAFIAAGSRLTAQGRAFPGTFVSMGNPHFVCFVDDIDSIDIARYGSAMERDKVFPDRCNIEFACMLPNGAIRCRVWERGSGITLACGTGACATSAAATHTGRSGRANTIVMDGGELCIDWDEASGHVFMTGGAEDVFDGEILI